ncbi:hypothetical protein [Azospirillum sp. TSA6c]|uniref:hypothetical protein n=1 Tax=Azospirillum sp. A23 TaxID=3160608 RepID=UPI000D621FE7|nr:hypothetical protein TSA6c_26175 [Azospirillum sp. TSA6c]
MNTDAAKHNARLCSKASCIIPPEMSIRASQSGVRRLQRVIHPKARSTARGRGTTVNPGFGVGSPDHLDGEVGDRVAAIPRDEREQIGATLVQKSA